MCGLSGTFGDVSTQEEKAFKTLLIYSQIRGVDATGVGAVSRNPSGGGVREMRLAKDVGPPYFLFDTKAFDKCFYGFNQAYIGHNRSKTTGDSSRKCAHPFMFDDVLGAHNGTIDYQNKNRLEKGADFKTDSEAIFYNIQCHGIGDTIGRIEASEAYALTWYDRRDNTMNFIRNKERPLWYIYSKNRRTLFWASEYEILMAGTGREENRLQLADKPYIVTPDTHYRWVIPSSCTDELPEPERNKLENFKRVYQVNSMFKGSYYNTEKNTKDDKSTNIKSESEFDADSDYSSYGLEWDPSTKTYQDIPKKTVLETISESINVIKDSLSGTSTKVVESKVMTAEDVIKRQKYDKAKEIATKVVPDEKFPLMYKGSTMIVHMDNSNGNWHTFRWNPSRGEWDRFISPTPPNDIPYTILDIQSRHQFKHEGKGKNKRILYKGFRGSLLNQEQFNKFASAGCLQCERKPEWGHEVTFLNDEHELLCEWCSKIPHLVTDLIASKKKVG